MKTPAATATRVIHAPADQLYWIIADYRNAHPLILPKAYFLSLDVEQGGVGAGTIVSFTMRILGQTQSFRSLITEPEPGRRLVETDIPSETPTSFQVLPIGNGSTTQVIISTELKGAIGWRVSLRNPCCKGSTAWNWVCLPGWLKTPLPCNR
jgi:hypothetical protein